MKTVLSIVSPEKAPKELKVFATVSAVAAAISIFVFWWLAFVAVATSGRAFLLSFHKGTRDMQNVWLYRILAISGFSVGFVVLIYGFSR